jgi:uncharacterized protein (TIGR03086 family)
MAGLADAPAVGPAHGGVVPDPSTTDLLIALGRDREAVAAATRDSAVGRGGPMNEVPYELDGVQQLDELIPVLRALVDRIEPDQLSRPTPCTAFTVASVLEHMIGGATAFAPAFRGAGAPAAPPDGETLHEGFGRAMADLSDAVHTAGAQERTIASPFGDVPGAMFARYVAFDGLVHGWDLSVATGLPFAPRDGLVDDVDAFARDLLKPEMRDGDTFAEETVAPPAASRLERLAAFSGRRLPT